MILYNGGENGEEKEKDQGKIMRANIHLNPQMPFYPKDFLTHTAFLTDSQAIRYLWILCNMYIHGHLTEKQMISVCGEYDKELFEMFLLDEDGRYYDEKLEYEVAKRDEFQKKSVSRKQKKQKIGEQRHRREADGEEKKAYGSEKNVYLTNEEYERLKGKFGVDTDKRIEELCLYIKAKGDCYQSHYGAILKWDFDKQVKKDEYKYQERDYSDYEKIAAKYR